MAEFGLVRVRVLAVVLALVVSGCAGGGGEEPALGPTTTAGTTSTSAPPSTTTTAPAPTTTIPAVEAVAVGEEVGRHLLQTVADGGLRRWDRELVRFGWHGTPTPVDRRILDETLATLTALPGLPRLLVVADGGPADVPVHALPPDQWVAALGDLYGEIHTEEAGGLAGTRSVDGLLEDAAIVVDATIEQTQRSRTIVHEVLHALGLGHHDCPTGIVYGGPDATPGWTLTELDAAVLTAAYDPRLTPGLTAEQVAEQLQLLPGEGPGCPERGWQAVGGPGGAVLWCAVGPDPVQACQRAGDNPVGGPVPDGPTVAWLAGGALSDHDPRRYQAFSFEGARVLCERPTDGQRTPCERTETGVTVQRVDWWTDGTYLYPEP